MKLYIYEHCPFCTRARMIFGLKQLPVELAVILEGDTETPMRLIGKKTVPILQKDDGSCMGESLDIVRYVDSIGTPVLGPTVNPELDIWGQGIWSIALKLFIPRFTQGNFAELSTIEAREAYRLREERVFGDLNTLRLATPSLLEEVNPQLKVLESLLLYHTDLGISDITLWPILRSLSIVKGVQFPRGVHRYMETLEVRSQVPLLFRQMN